MEKRGVNLFVEMGPGNVLSGLNRKIGVLGKSISVQSVDDLKALAEVME